MKVRFFVHGLGRSGGVSTILSYARALHARDGWDAEVVVTGRPERDPNTVGGVPVRLLGDGELDECDVVVATWWATAEHLWEVPARRRLVFLQSIENRFYEERHFFERFAAEQVLTLPLHYVTVAGWIRDVLAELRPDVRCEVVPGGIDKDTFAAPAGRESHEGPLRVLVEGQPSLWFKGVEQAVSAVHAMAEPHELTVVAGDLGSAGRIDGARLVGGLDPSGMAALYAEHDVLVKLSRVESLGQAPIEAFHTGTPALVTPYTGHEEYMEHGRNGLVLGFDDQPGTARALDRLARDRGLLARLSEGGLATAASWPSAHDAAARFAAALEVLAAAPEPDAGLASVYGQRGHRRWLELSREHARQLDQARGAVRWHQRALAESRAHTEELNATLSDVDAQRIDALRQLEKIRSMPAYRAAAGARRAIRGRRG